MKSILDPNFRYVDSQHTDIRRTFARVRRAMKAGPTKITPTDTAKAQIFTLGAQRKSG